MYLEWDIVYCINNTGFIPPTGVTVSTTDSNRTLHISSLVTEFENICFFCYAMNELGMGYHFYSPIEFDCKTYNTDNTYHKN